MWQLVTFEQFRKTFLFIQLNLRREPHLTLFVHVVVQDKLFYFKCLIFFGCSLFLADLTHFYLKSLINNCSIKPFTPSFPTSPQ